jgi:hypothetical protein
LLANVKDAIRVEPESLEQTGYWADLWEGLKSSSADYSSGFRGPAVAAVRGGRSIPTEADAKAAKLRKSLEGLERKLAQPALEASAQAQLRYQAGQFYEELAHCGLGVMTSTPEVQTIVPTRDMPPAAHPAQSEMSEDQIKADKDRMNKMEKDMQGEVDAHRPTLRNLSR